MLLNIVMTWFILDIVALMIVLYDYWRWYGQTPNARLVGEATTVGTGRGAMECRHAKSSPAQATPGDRGARWSGPQGEADSRLCEHYSAPHDRLFKKG